MTKSKIYIVVQHDNEYHTYKSTEESKNREYAWSSTVRPFTEDDRGYTTTRATDFLQVFTVLKHGKFRECEKPISLMNAKSASGFSRRRNTMEIAPLLGDIP